MVPWPAAKPPAHSSVPIYQTQFHAEREELIALAADWVARQELSVVIERQYPEYEAVAMAPSMLLADAVAELEPVRRFYLAHAPLVVDGVITQEDFVAVNRNCLIVALEPLTEDGLRVSAVGTWTLDDAVLEQWLELMRELDAILHRGATAVDPLTGDQLALPNHRHTAGAHAQAEAGTPMLAAAGPTFFEFDDVARPPS
jgi:hypothetical protein